MSADFLTVDAADAVARSPMQEQAAAAGATFELRDGWDAAVHYGDPAAERSAAERAVAWIDTSYGRKLEIQGPEGELARLRERHGMQAAPRYGHAAKTGWWCPWHSGRGLLLCGLDSEAGFDELGAVADLHVVDVSSSFCSLTLAGPQAREVIARFCSLDLRPARCAPGEFLPGSLARAPGAILCEAEDRFRLLLGWALGEYLWSVVADAAHAAGGRPAGLDALAGLDQAREGRPDRA